MSCANWETWKNSVIQWEKVVKKAKMIFEILNDVVVNVVNDVYHDSFQDLFTRNELIVEDTGSIKLFFKFNS